MREKSRSYVKKKTGMYTVIWSSGVKHDGNVHISEHCDSLPLLNSNNLNFSHSCFFAPRGKNGK